MSSLELPRTIRLAGKSEVPRAYWESVDAGQAATFVEGFVLSEVEDPKQLFRFYAEVNVNNSRLWAVLTDLAAMLPDACACIFGASGDEVAYGDYQEKEFITAVLDSLQKELIQDCFLEFGLIYNDAATLIEVYVAESKFVKVWGVDRQHFEQLMKQHGIPAFEKMSFVDEFPKVRVPLTSLDTEARSTEEMIALLEKAFVSTAME
ncbi:hypothetical protein LJ737_13410 [Hymenobacter sp. 15J16-1T3B]|uniref:hypothetical protein n=1 Tax=Hymenobacter sp. 15J16-1T3B TaxID=2886941 RepID=UPI001D0FC5E1|nr:hypothetical protein [Hymenobacter sp. 15J16-1T3B]MCC3158240.1 hypothetical protein [Hymenobacter sp. 15J16-1T3B]